MIDILAWIGVDALVALVAIWAGFWLVGMLRTEIGRGLLAGLCVLGIIAWGVVGGIYLLAR